MVRPKSRKSVSRRSSILKASIAEQPLQHVKCNVSLYQESPTTAKQKRRVSFAEKKHVKKFCDSVEQGTIWDTTYEESSNENTGQIELNNQCCKTINNENHSINDGRVTNDNRNVMNDSLDLTEPISTITFSKSICVEEISIRKSIPVKCLSTDMNEDNHSSRNGSKSNIGICADKNIVVYNDISSLNDIENVGLNKTCVQDISMEVTEIPYVISFPNTVPITHKQLLEDKENIPMSNIINKSCVLSTLQNKMNTISDKTQYLCTEQLEFAECLQSVAKLPELQSKLTKVSPFANDEDVTSHQTKKFHDTSMEITCAIPLKRRKNVIDQTLIFHDTPMDNTMVVTSIINKKETSTVVNASKIESDRTKLLDTSIEVTNGIYSLPHLKIVDGITDTVNTSNNGSFCALHNNTPQLNNDSMEFTTAAINLLRMNNINQELLQITGPNQCTTLGNNRLSSEDTKIFQNESMLITAPIHKPNTLHCDIETMNDVTKNSFGHNEDMTSSNTKIFQNESMAITAPIRTPNTLQCDIQTMNDVTKNSFGHNEDITSSNTKIFQNESMLITAPIHKPSTLHCDIETMNDVTKNSFGHNEDMTSSNTKIFQNESMAITAPIRTPKTLQCDIQTMNDVTKNSFGHNEDITSSNTKIFQNESMAITAPIRTPNTLQCDIQTMNDVTKNSFGHNEDITSSNTKIFQNESMLITAPIHKPSTLHCDIETMNDVMKNSPRNNEDITSSNTKIFQNESMAITAPIRTPNTLQCVIQTMNDVTKNSFGHNEDITSSNTKIFQNESMAITAPIRTPNTLQCDIQTMNDVTKNSFGHNEDMTSSRTKIFQNESMAITAPIRTPNTLQCDIQTMNDVTKNSFGHNEDMTSSRTKIFQNESMAITAPIRTPNTLQCDIQTMNDVTKNLFGHNEDITSSNTKIFQNETMAITAPIRTLNTLQCDIQTMNDVTKNLFGHNEDITSSNTKIFQYESMAITAPIRTLNTLQCDIQTLNNLTKNSPRNSEDITSQNTAKFQNISMEVTSAIKDLPILSNLEKLFERTEGDHVNSNINEMKDKASGNNKSVHEIVNDTLDSCKTNYIGNFENSSTETQPMNGLTSLISSFVYADMMEEDSFIQTMKEDEPQCMKNNIAQETKCQQNNINTKSIADAVNVEITNIQSLNKCIVNNEENINEHEYCSEYHCEHNNVRKDNVIDNGNEKYQCDPNLFLSNGNEIHENVFENSANHKTTHKTVSDSPMKIEIISRNKQLIGTKNNIEGNSATYITKHMKSYDMDIDKYTNDHSTKNQISHKSSVLSPILLSGCNQNKLCIAENNLIADKTSNINLNDSYIKGDCNNSSSNEEPNHVTSHEKFVEKNTFQKGTFSSLVHQLKIHMYSNDCIWDVYFEDIDKQMLVVSFISTSLLIVIFTQSDVNTAKCVIKHIHITSRLENDEDVLLSIAHKLLKDKINVEHINRLFKYDEDVVPLLNHISEDVKSVLDFIFDLKQLDDANLMEINTERVTFIVRSKYMNIILKITMDVQLFDKIDSSNINIICILGTVRKEDTTGLITNIKKDHRFLRRYMSDIKNYIDIIEQAHLINKNSCS